MNKFIENIKSCDEIKAVLLYGSVAMGSADEASDIDLIICSDSENFHTPLSVYETASKYIESGIKPTIKSRAEFSPDNYVTMSRRYIQHLHNVGQVIFERGDAVLEERIENMWSKLKDNSKLNIAYMMAPSLIIRHRLFELYKGNFTKVMSDDLKKVDAPTKYFWQEAVGALKLDISREDESKLIEKFYEIIPCGKVDDIINIRASIKEVNSKIKEEALSPGIRKEIKEIYFNFKNIVERDMWALNEYLGVN